jgi:NAD(P)H-dependent FMN reductase
MTTTPKILAFAGSLRRDSLNKKLIRIAAAGAEQAGADVTLLDLKDYPLPIYDGDIEAEGWPEHVVELKGMFRAHDGLLISSPEYNSSISAALKNLIDWVSRPEEGHPPLDAFNGRCAGLMSAAAGGLGGTRALPHVRSILQNIGVIVMPTMVGIPQAHNAFNDDGSLQEAQQQAQVEKVAVDLVEMLRKVKG